MGHIPGAKARKVTAENYDWYTSRWAGHPYTLQQIQDIDGVIVEYAHGPWQLLSGAEFDLAFKRVDTEEIQGWFSVVLKSDFDMVSDAMVDIVREKIGTEIYEVIREAVSGETELEVDCLRVSNEATTDVLKIIARELMKKETIPEVS